MKKILTLFVSEQPLTISGFNDFFQSDPVIKHTVKMISEVYDKYESIEKNFDVIILDDDSPSINNNLFDKIIFKNRSWSLSNQTVKRINRIIYTDRIEISRIRKIINSGIASIVCKYSENEELREAIIKVKDHERYYCKNISALLNKAAIFDTILTSREREVLYFIQLGLNYKEIAVKLFISNHTVNRHIEDIRHKLGINRTKDLIKIKNA